MVSVQKFTEFFRKQFHHSVQSFDDVDLLCSVGILLVDEELNEVLQDAGVEKSRVLRTVEDFLFVNVQQGLDVVRRNENYFLFVLLTWIVEQTYKVLLFALLLVAQLMLLEVVG